MRCLSLTAAMIAWFGLIARVGEAQPEPPLIQARPTPILQGISLTLQHQGNPVESAWVFYRMSQWGAGLPVERRDPRQASLLPLSLPKGNISFSTPAGEVEVGVLAVGFLPMVRKVVVGAGQKVPLTIELQAAPPFRGVVLDEEGKGLEKAVVALKPSSFLRQEGQLLRIEVPPVFSLLSQQGIAVITDAQGNFSFPFLPAEKKGEFQIQVSKEGYQGVQQSVSPPQLQEGLRIVLKRLTLVDFRLRITDPQGRSLPGVQVEMTSPYGPAFSGKSDAGGEVVVKSFPQGEARVILWAQGFPRTSRQIQVEQGGEYTLALSTGGKVGGTLLNAAGQPLGGVEVLLVPPSMASIAMGQGWGGKRVVEALIAKGAAYLQKTAPDGSFTFPAVSAEEWALVVPGHRLEMVKGEGAQGWRRGEILLTVREGQEIRLIVKALPVRT